MIEEEGRNELLRQYWDARKYLQELQEHLGGLLWDEDATLEWLTETSEFLGFSYVPTPAEPKLDTSYLEPQKGKVIDFATFKENRSNSKT